MKRLMNGFFVTSGLVLAASAVGILVGVERLLQTQPPKRRAEIKENHASEPSVAEPVMSVEMPAAVAVVSMAVVSTPQAPAEERFRELEPQKTADRHFSIKRTRSEVGYVYWILEGHGKYKCFVLCDSWDEAVTQAKARMDDTNDTDSAEALSESLLSLAVAT